MNAFWAYIYAWISTLILVGIGLSIVYFVMEVVKWVIK